MSSATTCPDCGRWVRYNPADDTFNAHRTRKYGKRWCAGSGAPAWPGPRQPAPPHPRAGWNPQDPKIVEPVVPEPPPAPPTPPPSRGERSVRTVRGGLPTLGKNR